VVLSSLRRGTGPLALHDSGHRSPRPHRPADPRGGDLCPRHDRGRLVARSRRTRLLLRGDRGERSGGGPRPWCVDHAHHRPTVPCRARSSRGVDRPASHRPRPDPRTARHLPRGALRPRRDRQGAPPRPSLAPDVHPTATPRPTNAANDLIYLRSVGSGGVTNILAIDARTGATTRTLADGSLSSDRATLYAPELVDGATRTLVHVVEVATSRELRSFTLDGAYRAIWTDSGLTALSRDGNHLALANSPVKIDGDWLTKFAVVGASSGATEAVFEVKGQYTYGFAAFSPDGRSLYLNQFGEGGTKLRVFDVPSATLLPAVTSEGAGLTQNGFRTPGIVSPDGRWMFSLDAGSATTNCTSTDGPQCSGTGKPPYVLALDLVSRRAATVALPVEQRSGDFEKYLLWSLAVAPDGSTVYAINPTIGVIDEIDARQMTIRRTKSITVSRADQGAWAAIGRFFFPIAEAKRYITGG